MRKLIIAGNWKMNKDAAQTLEFCNALSEVADKLHDTDVIVIAAPAYPFLHIAQTALKNSGIALSAQDVSAQTDGAYTGEVSATMLRSLNLGYCIVGHSERRQYHGETDALIRLKVLRLLDCGIKPILCVGETLEQRKSGATETVLATQLDGCLQDVPLTTGDELVIAYEPVWAIGTGRTATSEQAQSAHAFVRQHLAGLFGEAVANRIYILYGGSMKPENIAELIAQNDIDGGLIGGASLKIGDFSAMISSAIAKMNSR